MFFVFLDIVVDPVALRGSRWFLGQIFWYPEGGLYFGVPLSNFAGWAIVGAIIIILFQRIDAALVQRGWMREQGVRRLPGKALWGAALYYLLLLFNITITFMIGEPLLGCIGLFIFTPVTVILFVLLGKPANQVTAEELEAHGHDFPQSPLVSWSRCADTRKG
jgi:putative membrane protein